MLGGRKPEGYTIVEVMIFLAVSGVMFLLAASFVNGKQANVEFHNGVNSLNASLRNVVNDVQNGTYSSDSVLKCQKGAPTGQGQGTNGNCIFLGKAVDFGTARYDIVGVAGNRTDNSGDNVSSLVSALPQALSGDTDAKAIDTTPIRQICQYSTANPGGGSSYGFAIFSNINSDASVGQSGAPTNAVLYGYPNPLSGGSSPNDSLIATLKDAVPLTKLVIYVDDGRRVAAITMNGDADLTTSINYSYSGGSIPC